MWMLLTPREVEIVNRPAPGENSHATLVRMIQRKLNAITGDLELTDPELVAVTMSARNYQQGHELQFRAILEAARRHRDY